MNNENIRKNLIEVLTTEPAHVNFERAIAGIPPELRNKKPAGLPHSIWDEVEHIRISIEDIIEYTLNREWVSPDWPDKFWPAEKKDISDDEWENSLNKINESMQKTINLIENDDIDLSSEIPHGEGRTYLREILLIIDHNAYHVGQILLIRKLLNIWNN